MQLLYKYLYCLIRTSKHMLIIITYQLVISRIVACSYTYLYINAIMIFIFAFKIMTAWHQRTSLCMIKYYYYIIIIF